MFSIKVTDEENLSESKSEDHFYSKIKSLGLAIVEKQNDLTKDTRVCSINHNVITDN